MPRLARMVLSNVAHHITQRGNNRQDVFFVDDDRQFYLRVLKEQCAAHGVGILGYCLMTNHIHLVVLPSTPESLAAAVGRSHFRYTQYINQFHRRSGHLWQGRFFSCALDEPHFLAALRYIEQNPVRARLVEEAGRYAWSSAQAHLCGHDATGLLSLDLWSTLTDATAWQQQLREPMRPAATARLRQSTERGWPLAGDRWLATLERLLGRRLRPLPAHRPLGAKDRQKRQRRSER